jgi:hypothetical protein
LEELSTTKTLYLQLVRPHLESFGSRVIHYIERLLLLNVIHSIINIIYNFNALLYGLPLILIRKNICLLFWHCKLRMLIVRKALSPTQITNMQGSVEVGFLEIGKHIVYCVFSVVACATSKILYAFFTMNLDNVQVVAFQDLRCHRLSSSNIATNSCCSFTSDCWYLNRISFDNFSN